MFYKIWLSLIFSWSICCVNFGQTIEENSILLPLPGFSKGQMEWGDYDRDGDLDLLVCAESGSDVKLMRNDGTVFTEIASGIPTFIRAKIKWTDYNLDGYLDVIISGYPDIFAENPVIRVYRNDNNGTFSNQTPAELNGLTLNTDFKLIDLDNDGDEDLYLPGNYSNGQSVVYFNKNGVYVQGFIGLTAYDNNSSWADFNGDGFIDVAISGNGMNQLQVYKGLGDGAFEDIGLTVAGVSKGKIQWIDYDIDGDLDLCFMGTNSSASPSFRLLKNTAGVFTAVAGIPNLDEGDFEWGDFNNDGFLDLLLSGRDQSNTPVTNLYISNSGSSFTLHSFALTPLGDSNVELIDIDLDGDLDIIISGRNGSFSNIFKLYLNRLIENSGATNSAPTAPISLTTDLGSEIKLKWVDATDDKLGASAISYNVLIQKGSQHITNVNALLNGKLTKLIKGNAFLNDFYIIKGLQPGSYTWSVQAIDQNYKSSPFASVKVFSVPYGPHNLTYLQPYFSTVQLSWADTLSAETGFQVFRKAANGTYASIASLPAGSTNYTDMNVESGNYNYVIKAVYGNYLSPSSNEITVTVAMFSKQNLLSLDAVESPSIVWADIDGDNDLDAIAAGNTGAPAGSIVVFKNAGNFSFTSDQIFGSQVKYENLIARDFDSDGDIDLLITRGTTSLDIYFYKNTGGVFSYASEITLATPTINSIKEADFDNDGRLDLLVQTKNNSNQTAYKLYRNKGNFVFEDTKLDISAAGVYGGNPILGDYDLDGFVDILMTGFDASSRGLLRNYQGEEFKPVNISLPELSDNVSWFDYDSDGDLDLELTSSTDVLLYQNTNNVFTIAGTLSTSPNSAGDDLHYSYMDFNNDGRTDIFLTGTHPLLYQNNGNGTFKLHGFSFPGYAGFNNFKSYHLADFDKDGDIDIVFCGLENFNTKRNVVFVNQIRSNSQGTVNQPPAVPSNLLAVVGKQVSLSWNKSIDDKSNLSEISYNVELERQGTVIRSGESNSTGSVRRITGKGNNGFTNLSSFTPWQAGNYNYRVQALDASETPSAFSAWKSFYIPYGPHALTGDHSLFNEVTLQWLDTLNNVDYFIVERRKLNSRYEEIATVEAEINTFIDLLPDYNFIYYYRVRAVRSSVPSAYSNEIVIDTNRPLPPVIADTTLYTCAGPFYTLTAQGTNVKWYDAITLSSAIHTGASYTVNLTTNKIFYLTQEVGGKVSYVKKFVVTMQAEPNAPQSIENSYCEDDVIPLLTVAGFGVKWYGDELKTQLVKTGNSHQPINTGSDQIFYVTQSVGTCESASGTVTINVHEIEAVLSQQGGSLRVDHENAESYYWFRNGILKTITYGINTIEIEELGSYTVQVFDNNCDETSSPLQVDFITDIENQLDNRIIVYPNPSEGDFTVSGINTAGKPVTISIINTKGQILFDQVTTLRIGENLEVHTKLPAGPYVIEIKLDGRMSRNRLMIIK